MYFRNVRKTIGRIILSNIYEKDKLAGLLDDCCRNVVSVAPTS